MNINPGELNKKIQIISVNSGVDGEGYPVEGAESIVRNCRAKVTNVSGTEVVKSNAEFATIRKRFLIRAGKSEINTGMFIKYQGKKRNIRYINEYADDGKYVELWTEDKEAT